MSVVRVDPIVCEATGFCVRVAPDLFALDSDVSTAVDRELDENEMELAREAAEMCPTRAIVLGS